MTMASTRRCPNLTASKTTTMRDLPTRSLAKGALVMERHMPDPRTRGRLPRPTPPLGGLRSMRPRAARLTRTVSLGMAVTYSVTVGMGSKPAVTDSVTVWLGSKPPWPCQDSFGTARGMRGPQAQWLWPRWPRKSKGKGPGRPPDPQDLQQIWVDRVSEPPASSQA